jgi:hypothetical protein
MRGSWIVSPYYGMLARMGLFLSHFSMSAVNFAGIAELASVISALATAGAAVAAWRSASASGRMLKEAERTRVQSAEPCLSVSFPRKYFTISWRPQTGEVPMVTEGTVISAYGIASLEPSALMISNFGGGPALDLRISIDALASDRQVQDTDFTDTGAAPGAALKWSQGLLSAARSARGEVRISTSLKAFASSCAGDAPVEVELIDALLLRLLPTTMQLERDGYFPRGTPGQQGRIAWNVHIQYRTVLGEEKVVDREIYAERVRIDQIPSGSGADWMEKFYRCELSVAPTNGFETTPRPVDAHASGTLGVISLVAPQGSVRVEGDQK